VQARSQGITAWSRGVGMFGVNTERKIRGPVREMRAGRVWGAARCLPRGQGLCSRTVAMSQAPEDRARTKRRRVLTQIVLSRRGRLVSRFGQNDVKSTTWTPSTPSGHAQHVGIARHTRRHVAGIARRARRTGGRCTNSPSCPIQQVHVCEFAKRSCVVHGPTRIASCQSRAAC
jgi:hypothetical protein